MLFQPSSDDGGGDETPATRFLRPKLGSKTYKRGEATAASSHRCRRSLTAALLCTLLVGGVFLSGQVLLVDDDPLAPTARQKAALAAVEEDDSELVMDVITRAKLSKLQSSLRHMLDENEALKTQLQTLRAESSATSGRASSHISLGAAGSSRDPEASSLEAVQHRDVAQIGPVSDVKKKMSAYRFYCMVPTIFAPHRVDKIKAVVTTWGRRCDVIKLFVDPAPDGETFPKYFPVDDPSIQVEMVQLPLVRKNDEMARDKRYTAASCKDHGASVPCRHIWEKVWRAWDYVYDNDLDKADFFAKIDDDTFFLVEFAKLHFAINDWDPEEPRYFGHVSHQAPKPFVNGAWVGLSRGALRKVVPVYKEMPREYGPRENFRHGQCVDRDGASQELVEAVCLDSVGIVPTAITDQYGMQKINIFRVSDALFLRKREGTRSWYWYKKPRTSICCSETPIAFHWYKSPSDLYRFERYLYNRSDTFLDDNMYSRDLADKLKNDPQAKIPAVISRKSRISTYVFWEEIHYLWMVKENLRRIQD